MSTIVGIGNGLYLSEKLSFLKSGKTFMVPFFLAMENVGDAHSQV
jgi:hypothetical protein